MHDWLVNAGGAERALAAIVELFPSPIYTLIKDDALLRQMPFAKQPVHTSFLQKLPHASRLYRNFLPLFPRAIERFDLSGYDLILSSSHAVAKGVRTIPGQLHLCYCYTPMRYAWDLQEQYLGFLKGPKKWVARACLQRIQRWDLASSQRVHAFCAISHHVAARVQRNYGREAAVIYPPVDTDRFCVQKRRDAYYLTLSRLVPYKRIDLIVEGFAQMPHRRLVVIGDGPEMGRIRAKATKNVELVGRLPDAQVTDYMQRARAFLFAAEEDFGITVVEAQAAGVPVIAFGQGGALETVVAGKTGIFFKEQTAHSLCDAVAQFERWEEHFDPHRIRAHAEAFSADRFKEQFRAFVTQKRDACLAAQVT